jgi:peroxiredoxin
MPSPTEQNPPQSLAQVLSELQHLDISLAERLKAYAEQSARRYPDLAKAYDALVARLESLDRSEIGPKLGTQMPEFLLPDEAGNLVSLSSLLRQGPVVISINRGHWCPYCRLELLAYAARHQAIRSAGAQMVSIMADSSEFTRDYRNRNALPFGILSDVDLGYSELLGLVFWISEDVERLYRQIAIDLARYHGNQGCFLPFAAKFVVDPKGIIRMREVNVEFRQRLEPDAIISALNNL